MRNYIKIQITDEIKREVYKSVYQRNQSVANRRSGGNGNLQQQFNGRCAEAAFKMHAYGQSLEEATRYEGRGDGGTDFIVDGVRFDLKTRTSMKAENPPLYYEQDINAQQVNTLNGQFYLLGAVHSTKQPALEYTQCYTEPLSLVLVGVMSKEDVKKEQFLPAGSPKGYGAKKWNTKADAYNIVYKNTRPINSIEDLKQFTTK